MTHPKHTHDDSAGDRLIDMKCTHCGYEEKMPAWCYGEEADYLIDIGNPEPPRWQCPKCYNETLCRKPQRLYTSPSSFNLIYFLSAFTSALLLIYFLRFGELSYKMKKGEHSPFQMINNSFRRPGSELSHIHKLDIYLELLQLQLDNHRHHIPKRLFRLS